MSISTIVDRIATFQPAKVIKHWNVDLPCYTWTVEINGRDVWCAEIVDVESGYSYFFYDEYECQWDDGSTFLGDLLVSVAPDESYSAAISDETENVVYNIGEVNNYIFVDESTNYTVVDESTNFVDESTNFVDESTYVEDESTYEDDESEDFVEI